MIFYNNYEYSFKTWCEDKNTEHISCQGATKLFLYKGENVWFRCIYKVMLKTHLVKENSLL